MKSGQRGVDDKIDAARHERMRVQEEDPGGRRCRGERRVADGTTAEVSSGSVLWNWTAILLQG